MPVNKHKPYLVLSGLALLSAIEGLAVFIWILSIPSDGKNSLLLGFSMQRLGILSGVMLGSLLFLWLGLILKRNSGWIKGVVQWISRHWKNGLLIGAFCLLTLIFANLLLVPDYRWEKNIYLFERLRPIVVWMGLINLQVTLVLTRLRLKENQDHLKLVWKNEHRLIITGAGVLFLMGLIWAWMAWSGMGIAPDITFWNDPGVPLLSMQVLIAVIAGAAFYVFEGQIKNQSQSLFIKIDLLLCCIIAVSAAVLWILTPQSPSYFAPGPYPPNQEYYPYSDAGNYDLAAQTALVGRGYYSFYGCADKPLYLTFLTWLHVIGGEKYATVIAWQSGLFAILPVLLYLIGSQINRRSLGLIAAILSIFKEANAIGSATLISTSMSKMMMAEIPTAIMLAVFTLVLIQWIKSKGEKVYLAGVLGGVIGLATLLRLNMFIFLPFSLLLILIILFKQWKKAALSACLFTIVFLASVLPWELRSQSVCHVPPFYYISGPLRGVIFNNRFNISSESSSNINKTVTPPPQPVTAVPQQQENTGTEGGQVLPVAPVYIDDPDVGMNTIYISPAGKTLIDGFFTHLGSFGEKVQFVSNHFFHNLLTTFLIFPTTVLHDDIPHIASPNGSFWADDWNGQVKWNEGILIMVNLALFAFGISTAWRKWKLAGLGPLFVYLTYCAGLAVARTSGGRYIVTVEWALFIYYAGGIMVVLGWVLDALGFSRLWKQHQPDSILQVPTPKQSWLSSGLVFCVFLSVGILIPGTEKLLPLQTFQTPTTETWLAAGAARGYAQEALEEFMPPSALIYSGKAINPRFFFFGQNNLSGPNDEERIYPRLTFTLVGAGDKLVNVILPTNQIPSDFQNGLEVSVWGCKTKDKYLEALMVIGKNGQTFYRNPPTAVLKCPLPEIKCNNNHVCQSSN